MSVVEITIASAASHFVQENEVVGKALHFEFEWIENQGFWMLHIADESDRPLAIGTKLQSDWPLYTHYEADQPFAVMLLARTPGQILGRQNLSRHFTLVAYEII